jgi:23S rRNA (guanosine2251-2'-O)-methyltransferase
MEKRNFKKLRPGANASKESMVFGIRAVEEALKANREIEKIVISTVAEGYQYATLLTMARNRNIAVQRVPREKIEREANGNHQGVLAYLSAVIYQPLADVIQHCQDQGRDPFILILDRITDVRNIGAIVRTAECAGVDAVVVPIKGSAMLNADAMKTSAGGLNYIPVCREPDLVETVKYLQASGLKVAACTEDAAATIFETDLNGPCAVIMGSEGEGIENTLLRICDHLVKIPMFGRLGSLNVSVATALITYEVVRQRHYVV